MSEHDQPQVASPTVVEVKRQALQAVKDLIAQGRFDEARDAANLFAVLDDRSAGQR